MRAAIVLAVVSSVAVPLTACESKTPPPSKGGGGVSSRGAVPGETPLYRKTTTGSIEVGNLHAKIDAQEALLRAKPGDLTLASAVVETRLYRASFLGTYMDFDRAFLLAETAVEQHAKNPAAWLLRAQVRAHVHRFADALADLATAEKLGADAATLARRRASISIVRGEMLDDALAVRLATYEAAPGYNTAADLASVHLARGEYDKAEAMFLKSLEHYRDVSPMNVGWVFFQRGLMWAEHAGKPEKARRLYEEAVTRLPAYVQAVVHLAEMQSEAGERDAAIALLTPVVEASDEPEAIALLGELTGGEGGAALVERARARYEELLAKYPLAFADHATEFYLGPGNDPRRALELATRNHANRKTDRATRLLDEAKAAAGKTASAK